MGCPNVQVMALEGDKEGMRMAANQVHYTTLRGLKDEEYKDNLGAKSYVETLVGKMKVEADNGISKESVNKWHTISRRMNKVVKTDRWSTIFIEKIPLKAKSGEIWNFFKKAGKVTDIVLQKKRDISGNRIGFVKSRTESESLTILERLRGNDFVGIKLDLKVSKSNSKNIKNKSKEVLFRVKEERPKDDVRRLSGDGSIFLHI